MASKRKSKPDWSKLPPELLTSIAERLPARLDILRYRAVCRSFRSSMLPPPVSRCLYPHLRIPVNRCWAAPNIRHVLKQSTFYAIEPLTKVTETQICVLRVEESGDGTVSVKDPFNRWSDWNIRNEFPETLNLLDYRVKEMGKLYELDINLQDIIVKCQCKKVVVSDDGLSVMGITHGPNLGKIYIWRKGDEDWKRIIVDDRDNGNPQFHAEDIIYHNEKFYAISYGTPSISCCVLFTIDPKSQDVTRIGSISIKMRDHERSKYFVKSSNDLLLVIKYWKPGYYERVTQSIIDSSKFSRTDNCGESCFLGFRILRFDEEKNRFVRANNAFKDRVVFIGIDFGFTVAAKEFPRLKRNSVYLDDVAFKEPGMDEHPYYGVFDLGKNTGRPLYAPLDNIFWPPPTWLKPNL